MSSSDKKLLKNKTLIFSLIASSLIILSLNVHITKALPTLTVESYFTQLNEQIIIDVANYTTNTELRLDTTSSSYRFMGDLKKSIDYYPQVPGIYTITLLENSTAVRQFNISIKASNTLQNNVEVPQQLKTMEKTYFMEGIITPRIRYPDTNSYNDSHYRIGSNWLKSVSHENESLVNSLSIYDSRNKNKYVAEEFEDTTPLGEYDVELEIANNPVKSIFFKNVNLAPGKQMELRLDDLSEKTGKPSTAGNKQFYVIDPTSVDFKEAFATITAVGDVLWKCKDWNYANRACLGKWTPIMELIPGTNYTIRITPDDPAFNETTRDADHCYNEQAAANCTAAERTAIIADGGTTYTFNRNVGAPVRISFQDEAQLVNDIVNCTVFIKGYDSDGNTWTVQFGNWSPSQFNPGVGIAAPNPLNTINRSCTSYFPASSNESAAFNNFAIRVSTNDIGQAATAYIDYVYVRINFSIRDVTAPYFTAFNATPISPAMYNATRTYQFNATWLDDQDMGLVRVQHNFTGILGTVNTTGNFSSNYFFNFTGLAAGSYQWRMIANDSVNNTNTTMAYQNYTVNREQSLLTLFLNGSSSNLTINNSGALNITGILNLGEGNITLFENNVHLKNGSSPQNFTRTYTARGRYNITLNYSQTQNFTASQVILVVTVNDTLPPGNVTNLNETLTTSGWILWNWTNPTDADFNYSEVWLNGVNKINTTLQYYNATSLFSDTEYNISIRTVDDWESPNTGPFINDIARTNASTDTTPPALLNIKNSSITDTSVNISWDTDEASTTVIKYTNNSGNYPWNYTDLTLILNHSRTITGLYPNSTYYYVVNSSDSAGNSNQSTEINFTTLPDQTPPAFSNITSTPSSPATYSPTANYQFNTTWADVVSVNTVYIQHNFTGNLLNYTITGNSSGTYYYNYTVLAARTYSWRMIANDSRNNINNTMPFQEYTVQKAVQTILLRFNGLENNITINETQSVNITANISTPQGNLTIYEQAASIIQGLPQINTTRTYNAPGTYTITAEYNETQNFTYTNLTRYITVNDIIPPTVLLTSPANNSLDKDGSIIFEFNVTDTGTVLNCSLLINSALNQTKAIITQGPNTFTIDNVANGLYSWRVNCSDTANNTNVSQTWVVNATLAEFFPVLQPILCTDSFGGCNASLMNTSTPNAWEDHGTLLQNNDNYVYINVTAANITPGSALDWAYIYQDKYQETLQGTFSLAWYNTTAAAWIGICTTAFGSSVFQAHDAVNCTFTNATRPSITQFNSGLQIRANFLHTGNPSGKRFGTDTTYVALKFTEDTTPPVVELLDPNDYRSPGIIFFDYIPSDLNLKNCTLHGDFNGTTFAANRTINTTSSGSKHTFNLTLPIGFYTWNVLCCDIANNCQFDTLGGPLGNGNFNVNITNPDLTVADITFNTTASQARQGMNITINATVRNIGNVNATGIFTVQFYDGDPDSGGTQIGSNIVITDLAVQANKTVNTSFIINRGGPINIFVLVDTPLATNGSIAEINEANNMNNKTLHVPGYHYFYGTIKNNFILGTLDNKSLYYYPNITNATGNIFTASSNSIINFLSLQALGRNTSNGTGAGTADDFTDADTALNMTSFNDSIIIIYTAGTGISLQTASFTILNQTINNVPIVNSTNTTNFITGIFWDTSDGGTAYNGTQDIVFATKINFAKPGAYGTYDYEIKVPALLQSFKQGTAVSFYSEIITN